MTNYSVLRKIKYKKVRKIQPNFYEYTGIYKTDPVEMQLFVYAENHFEEYHKVPLPKVEKELNDKFQEDKVKWLNVHGLHNVELIKEIGDLIDIEPYIIGDILNTTRRTKMEELHDTLFFNIKSILPDENLDSIRVEQISFILKENLLVSFQEKKSDFFTHIRERIRSNAGIVCRKKNDYLLYLMLDAVMENFYITIENYEDRIEALMIESKTNHRQDVLIRIENNRENLNFLKRAIVPLRDALFSLKSFQDDNEYDGIESANYTFFARLHQKCLELLEQIDYDLNSLDSASHFHFSAQSQRMNEIMKTLTVVSVVFIPLTFIVGIYGMNFDNMPELHWKYGYFEVLAGMFLLVVGMIVYFKKKKWF
ncbi:magnesium and cobalt transport protein CorA [Flavobacterium cauense R2A-7]|uniref:Magnesium transport protein CorA n=1 Tax=Flavobacterium cauense R2A-7 TaxID=1341154 RepID=V6S2W0_9FLAO|nr:magnesium and cobalt transport protein CorA [Flavobacterium cauense R2A-7]TWI13852.1 magnesium transporter [Flavobacterium cauense R2A-7]